MMRGGPIISSRKSFGSLPSWWASSAMKDWIDHASATLVAGPQPAHASRALRPPALLADVGHVEGRAHPAHPQLDVAGMLGIRHKMGHKARPRAAVAPGDPLF